MNDSKSMELTTTVDDFRPVIEVTPQFLGMTSRDVVRTVVSILGVPYEVVGYEPSRRSLVCKSLLTHGGQS